MGLFLSVSVLPLSHQCLTRTFRFFLCVCIYIYECVHKLHQCVLTIPFADTVLNIQLVSSTCRIFNIWEVLMLLWTNQIFNYSIRLSVETSKRLPTSILKTAVLGTTVHGSVLAVKACTWGGAVWDTEPPQLRISGLWF